LLCFEAQAPENFDLMPSENGQLAETCKGNKYVGKSISKLQMDIELTQIRVLI
jgi:hypothetical protein